MPSLTNLVGRRRTKPPADDPPPDETGADETGADEAAKDETPDDEAPEDEASADESSGPEARTTEAAPDETEDTEDSDDTGESEEPEPSKKSKEPSADEDAADGDEADEDETDDGDDGGDQDARPEKTGRWRRRAPIALGVATVLLAGLAVWFHQEAHGLRSGVPARNEALTDNARTSEVQGQIGDAVNSVFSYNYADMATTQQAARNLLTGKAVGQYATMLAGVRAQAPAQKLVLTTTVTQSGVEMLEGDRARLLLFADQRSTRTAAKDTTYAAAMIAVDAVWQDGRWKIANIDTLGVPR